MDLKEKVNNSAKFYGESFLDFDYKLAEFGFKTLKPFFRGDLALELGPASGYMTKSLISEFKTIHLVEGSTALINEVPDYANIIKHNAFFEDFETDLKFDTIIMSHVLEHISNPVAVLGRIRNWLKEDGVFLVSVPNAKSLHRLVAVEMGLLTSEYDLNQRDTELGHYRVYDTTSLRSHLEEASFKIEKISGYFLKPVSNGQIEKNWDQAMIDGFYKISAQLPEYCAEIYAVATK